MILKACELIWSVILVLPWQRQGAKFQAFPIEMVGCLAIKFCQWLVDHFGDKINYLYSSVKVIHQK